jgi:hypothetical protein
VRSRASLPGGGSTWTAVKTMDTTGSSTIRLVVNATGSAIITWSEVLDDDKPVERLARGDYRSIAKLVATLEYPGVS